MDFEILQTERLLLRKLTPEVYDYVFEHFTSADIIQFFGCKNEDEMAEERKKYEQGLSMYRKSLLIFQLLDKTTEQVIGWCGYHTWYVNHARAEIGYVLSDESRRGQGLMKEALAAVIHYGFRSMNLKRIEGMTATDNWASIKLLANVGFSLEGRLREHYKVGEVMEDSLMFSLLEREYHSHQLKQKNLSAIVQ